MKQFEKIAVFLCLMALIQNTLYSQSTYEGNDFSAPPGSYLGWDFPNNLDFKTNDTLRMRLLQSQTSTINGFPGIVQDGFLGLSDDLGFFSGTGPGAMIHINGGNNIAAQYQGFRPWMR